MNHATVQQLSWPGTRSIGEQRRDKAHWHAGSQATVTSQRLGPSASAAPGQLEHTVTDRSRQSESIPAMMIAAAIWNPRTLDKLCIYLYIMCLNPLNVCYMIPLLIFVCTCVCHDKHVCHDKLVYHDLNMYIQG